MDALQVLLSQTGWMLYASCLAFVILIMQAGKLVSVIFRAFLHICILHRKKTWIVAPILALCLYPLSGPVSYMLEALEHRYIYPVYVGQSQLSESEAIARYEREIRTHTTPAEFDTLRRRTAEIAAKINSTPAAIYETAWLECGLNPFRVRDDKVAAGWIQFTRAGLSGLGVSLETVIHSCKSRDISTIMNLTEAYLTRKCRGDMRNTIDLYLAVFAPAHIGKAYQAVVYAGFENPAYYKNAGLDGWITDGGKIVRGQRDGRITVGEIWLCLERKKGLLLKSQK